MAKVDGFLDELKNYDKENVHPECLKAIRPYLADPQFNADFIRSKSLAAAGAWDGQGGGCGDETGRGWARIHPGKERHGRNRGRDVTTG